MFEPRPQEPAYAFVPDADSPQNNRYGKSIETVPEGDALRGQSLNINGDSSVSDNPNRYKQHGFYFITLVICVNFNIIAHTVCREKADHGTCR